MNIKIIPELNSMIDSKFFERDSESVARDILGKSLVNERPNKATLYARIQEVGAWEGTKNNMSKKTLYAPGTAFILTSYGKNIFGISTEDVGINSCVTFLGAEIRDKSRIRDYANGPGNLAKLMEIDKEYDGVPLNFTSLWIGGDSISQKEVLSKKLTRDSEALINRFYFK